MNAPIYFPTEPKKERYALQHVDVLIHNWCEGKHVYVDIK